MYIEKKPKGFTLIELLVVMIIISIISTIMFIGYINYTLNARDANRLSTIQNINAGLQVYLTKNHRFPMPDGEVFSGAILGEPYVFKGEVGENITQLINYNKVPLDPLSNQKYTYGVNKKRTEYQIAGIIENKDFSYFSPIIEETYAYDDVVSKVDGNYKGVIKIKTSTGLCLSNIPSLIFSNNEDVELFSSGVFFVSNGQKNLPHTFKNTPSQNISTSALVKKILKDENADFINVCGENQEQLINNIKSNTGYLASFGGDPNVIDLIVTGNAPIIDTKKGRCGPAAKTYASDKTVFEGSLCSLGEIKTSSPIFPTLGNPTTWYCEGDGLKKSSLCQARISSPSQIHGVCGPAAKNYTSDKTTFEGDFCLAGDSQPTAPIFPGAGNNVSWICEGQNGGNDSGNCVVTREAGLTGAVGPWVYNTNNTVKCRYSAYNSIECDWSAWVTGGGLNYKLSLNNWECSKLYSSTLTGSINSSDSACYFNTNGTDNNIRVIARDNDGGELYSQALNIALPEIQSMYFSSIVGGIAFDFNSGPNIFGDYNISINNYDCQTSFSGTTGSVNYEDPLCGAGINFGTGNQVYLTFTGSVTSNILSPVNAGNLPTLSGIYPPHNGEDIAVDLTLTWEDSSVFDSYELSFGTDTGATNLLLNSSTTESLADIESFIGTYLQHNATYYWKVRGVVSGNYGSRSQIYSFTTMPLHLTSPANNATEVILDPVLTWDGISGHTYYVSFGTDTNASNIVNATYCHITATGGKLSDNCGIYLNGNTKYYWKVSADSGSTRSEIWNFTTKGFLTSPANNATEVILDPVLTWDGISGHTYYVSFGTDTNASNIVNATYCQITATGGKLSDNCGIYLNGNTKYYWKVSADSGSTRSEIWNFTTKGFLTSPANNATEVILDPVLTWDGISGYTYYVSFGTDTNASNIVNATFCPITGTGGKLSDNCGIYLNGNTKYYWKVSVDGGTTRSSIWNFTTSALKVTLTTPSQSSTGVVYNAEFQWEEISGADLYEISFGTNISATNISPSVYAFTSNTNSMSILSQYQALNANTKYYWKVRACFSGSCGAWSDIWDFTTKTAVEARTPILLSGINSETLRLDSPLLWNDVNLEMPQNESLIAYLYDISTVSDFSSYYCRNTRSVSGGTSSNYLISLYCNDGQKFLQPNVTYYWRVMIRYYNSSGVEANGPWSQTGVFTTQDFPGGNVVVKDIISGATSSTPANLTNVNGTLFFTASNGTSGVELWKSDGTEGGTIMVKDIRSGTSSSTPANLTNVNGTLFFTATNGTSGIELWKSDGTSSGTVLVKDINPGTGSSTPTNLTNVNGTLFFATTTDATYGRELWKSDGTEVGTLMVKDINPGTGHSITSTTASFTDVNGTLFFAATNGTSGVELWKSDGTELGTELVKDIYTGTTASIVYTAGTVAPYFTAVGSTLYFTARSGSSTNYELWKSDGTLLGTLLVKDIISGVTGSYPANLTNVNGTLFFSVNNGTSGIELWKSDGTDSGTILVKDVYTGPAGSNPSNLTNINGILFFTATNGDFGQELWKSDGTENGTQMIKNINPIGYSGLDLLKANLTKVGDILYFLANNGAHGDELWQSDGTDSGTFMIDDIISGVTSSTPANLTNVNGTLFFTATNDTIGLELWKK